ncbi:hypothetical protein Lal_00031361 [Lupinus albus]|nr:hypothetical protein Lal_00031361 [Lupinus albus]
MVGFSLKRETCRSSDVEAVATTKGVGLSLRRDPSRSSEIQGQFWGLFQKRNIKTHVLSGFPSSGANGKPSGSSNRNILQPTYLGAFGMANQVNQIGCSPNLYCNETINQMVKPCSNKLLMKVQEMEKQFSGSMFVSANGFNFFDKIKNDPQKYGFTNISKSCIQEGIPCVNRNEHYFWDFGHITETAVDIYTNECFSGSKMCFPNVQKLAHAHL